MFKNKWEGFHYKDRYSRHAMGKNVYIEPSLSLWPLRYSFNHPSLTARESSYFRTNTHNNLTFSMSDMSEVPRNIRSLKVPPDSHFSVHDQWRSILYAPIESAGNMVRRLTHRYAGVGRTL